MNAEERAELRAALENAWDAAEMTREEKRWLLNVADAAARYIERNGGDTATAELEAALRGD